MGATSRRSRRWAVRSSRSSAAFSSARSRSRPIALQQAVEAGDQVVVGVNRFRDEATATPQIQRIDAEGERRQIERLRQVRAERDHAAWRTALEALEATAAGDGNLIPAIIEAVRARATVGEISDRLRVAWGEHRELITV